MAHIAKDMARSSFGTNVSHPHLRAILQEHQRRSRYGFRFGWHYQKYFERVRTRRRRWLARHSSARFHAPNGMANHAQRMVSPVKPITVWDAQIANRRALARNSVQAPECAQLLASSKVLRRLRVGTSRDARPASRFPPILGRYRWRAHSSRPNRSHFFEPKSRWSPRHSDTPRHSGVLRHRGPNHPWFREFAKCSRVAQQYISQDRDTLSRPNSQPPQ